MFCRTCPCMFNVQRIPTRLRSLERIIILGSGCGSFGRAVASNTRGLQFESSHRHNFIYQYRTIVYCQLCIEKTKIKKKRPGMAHFFLKNYHFGMHDQNCILVVGRGVQSTTYISCFSKFINVAQAIGSKRTSSLLCR